MISTNPTLATIHEQLTLRRDTMRWRFRVARLAVFGSHAARHTSTAMSTFWSGTQVLLAAHLTATSGFGDDRRPASRVAGIHPSGGGWCL